MSGSKAARTTHGGLYRCACGKAAYPSRKEARRAARVTLPGETRMQEYRCEQGQANAWHFGHPAGFERLR